MVLINLTFSHTPCNSLDLKMELPSNPTGIASSTAEQVLWMLCVLLIPRTFLGGVAWNCAFTGVP